MKSKLSRYLAAAMGIVFFVSACFLDADFIVLPAAACIMSGLYIAAYGYSNGWCAASDEDSEHPACEEGRFTCSADGSKAADIIIFRKGSIGKRLLDA